ncbi:hypothetical protein ANCDUO_02644 [Ancylostoma duodenale]|uniref:Uncharacterized protein n=1 Tax=Ancylostoma duodenale TaxID=51022 RepID=A0A0C2DB85_9BILA|nr:hypothetical protein ANCDUO_02644 [Ancylostoma duodenale]
MALDKAKKMLRHIAYPDFILDKEKLDDYYSGGTDSYSQIWGNLSRWSVEHEFKRLIEPVDRNEYDFNPANKFQLPYSSLLSSTTLRQGWLKNTSE